VLPPIAAAFVVPVTSSMCSRLPKDLSPKSTEHFYFMLGVGAGPWSASTRRSFISNLPATKMRSEFLS